MLSRKMQKRFFPQLDLSVSEIGLGCWQLGGSDWGDLDEAKARRILHAAVDSGVDFLDTADVYGGGRSEQLIGQFLEETGGAVKVATKLGRGGGIYPAGYSARTLREAAEASLRRLGVSCLDLIQLHCVPTEILRRGEVFGWLRELQQAGKIRAFGASVESVEEGLICLEQPGLASLQIIFNLFRQKPVHELLDQAAARNVSIIVRLPLVSGLLTGKLTPSSEFAANDHRHYNRDGQCFNVGETFAGIPFSKGLELVEELRPLVPEGLSLAEMAQRWILDHPAVTTVITGCSSPEQVVANARVSALPPLSRELHDRLAEFYRRAVEPYIRGPY